MVRSAIRRWREHRAESHEPRSLHGQPDLCSPGAKSASRLIGVLVYQGVTTTEIDRPVDALAEHMQADVAFIGPTNDRSVTGIEVVRTVLVDYPFDGAPAIDVLVVPGGLGWERLVADERLMTWIDTVSHSARGVMAISTGSLILGAAGRLVGKDATGHWLARDLLASQGAKVSTHRTAHSEDNLLVTASGATAALELAKPFADRVRWGI